MAQKPTQNENPIDSASDEHLPVAPTSFVPGTLDMEDELVLTPSEFPILKVASRMGETTNVFSNGDLCFMTPDTICIAEANSGKADILIVYVKSFLKEVRKFVKNDPVPYRTYNTRAEALAAGERLEWDNSANPAIGPTIRDAGFLIMLARLGDGVMTTAPTIPLMGGRWVPVRFYAEKSQYGAARSVIRATKTQLVETGGFTSALWAMSSHPSKSQEFDNYEAAISLKRLLTEEEKAEFHSVMSMFGSVTFA
jgi:hypothetical protein